MVGCLCLFDFEDLGNHADNIFRGFSFSTFPVFDCPFWDSESGSHSGLREAGGGADLFDGHALTLVILHKHDLDGEIVIFSTRA